MPNLTTALPVLAALALTSACAGTGAVGDGNGLSKTLEEMQLQYPGMTPEVFAQFDADSNGVLDSGEQQAVFQEASSPDGIGGTAGELDEDAVPS
ncbi:EF-hand domain-containing protein [Loktanella salsilacus]|uniref:EF-hand domain-containing protein n=1 Tax=Loktanella salsilacus TaxID=195913 RepID=UPI003736827F